MSPVSSLRFQCTFHLALRSFPSKHLEEPRIRRILPGVCRLEMPYVSYGQNLVHGEGTSLSRVGPYRFCSGGTLGKPAWGYPFLRVGPYRFCSDANPVILSILLWSHLILSDTHVLFSFARYVWKNISTKSLKMLALCSCWCFESFPVDLFLHVRNVQNHCYIP